MGAVTVIYHPLSFKNINQFRRLEVVQDHNVSEKIFPRLLSLHPYSVVNE